MTEQHFPKIEAEYCLAEGGGVSRSGGKVKFASVQTLEKTPRAIELVARGVAGHGSVPLRTNPIAHLSAAVARVAAWKPPIRLNDTTRAYFKRLAGLSAPADAQAVSGHHRIGSEAGRCRRRVLPRARAAPRLDDPHVDLPEHLSGRLPRQRDPLGSARDARRAHASRRRPRAAARGSAQDRERSGDRGGLGPARRPAVSRAAPSSIRKRSRRSRPGSRSTTTRSRCRR